MTAYAHWSNRLRNLLSRVLFWTSASWLADVLPHLFIPCKFESHFTPECPRLKFSTQIKSHFKSPHAPGYLWGPTAGSNGPCLWSDWKHTFTEVPIIACDIYFYVTQTGLTEFPFSERCFQPLHHNLPVMRQTLLWKYSFSQKQMCQCRARSGIDFSLIAHLSLEQVAACHFGHLKLFVILLFWQDDFLCNTSPWCRHIARWPQEVSVDPH